MNKGKVVRIWVWPSSRVYTFLLHTIPSNMFTSVTTEWCTVVFSSLALEHWCVWYTCTCMCRMWIHPKPHYRMVWHVFILLPNMMPLTLHKGWLKGVVPLTPRTRFAHLPNTPNPFSYSFNSHILIHTVSPHLNIITPTHIHNDAISLETVLFTLLIKKIVQGLSKC